VGIGQQRRGWLGSAVLVVLVAALLLRPWEGLGGADAAGPASARVIVSRVVDGDTIEVELDGEREDVRYIGMLSRVSRPTLRLPAVALGVKERLVGLPPIHSFYGCEGRRPEIEAWGLSERLVPSGVSRTVTRALALPERRLGQGAGRAARSGCSAERPASVRSRGEPAWR
jgi:hypothetical protein